MSGSQPVSYGGGGSAAPRALHDIRICVVIPVFAPHADILERIVHAVREQVSHVVIVDDGSGTADEAFSTVSKHAEISKFSVNRGIAAAINEGIERARHARASHVLLLDQDSVPHRDMVAVMQAVLSNAMDEDENVAAVGPRFLDPYTGVLSRFTRLNRFGIRRASCRSAVQAVRTDFLISSGTLMPLQAIEVVGAMDESLFIDHVDTEWCLRARSKGFKLYGACNAVLEHSLGEGATRVWLGRWRHVHPHKPFRYYYIFRNTLLLMRRGYVPLAWCLHGLWYLGGLFLIAGVLSKDRSSALPYMLRGAIDGIKGAKGRIAV